MKLKEELTDLVQSGVIDEPTAQRIAQHLQQKKGRSGVMFLLGALSALFIALGLILIMAHNWEQMPTALKTALSLLPLLIGQGVCGYGLARNTLPRWLTEASALFTALSVGLAIAMVHQIYHLPESDIELFALVWLWLSLPLVYLLGAQAVALCYLLGVLLFGTVAQEQYFYAWYFYLLVGILPFYMYLIWKKPQSLMMSLLHYGIFLGVFLYIFGFWGEKTYLPTDVLLSFTGVALFLGKYLQRYEYYNAYMVSGVATITIVLYAYIMGGILGMSLSFHQSIFFYVYVLLLGIYLYQERYKAYELVYWYPLLLILLIFSGLLYLFADVLLLAFAIFYLIKGLHTQQLLLTNYAALTLILQIGYRFFDSSLSFIFKGLVFILLGVCFLLMNYWIIKQQKKATKP